jgi:glycosyltransferase involved in cell wall biosynthesis
MSKKLILIQTIVPSYRVKVMEYLRSQLQSDFKIYCGDAFFDPTISTEDSFKPDKKIKNTYLLNRWFLWQSGHWSDVFKDNIFVLSLNPRVISHWIILVLRSLLRKQTILWGHAWPRAGKNSKSDAWRQLMRKLSDGIIVYTEQQQEELKVKMPFKKIYAAPNAVSYKEEMTAAIKEPINDFIYVGRLVASKKPLVMYNAFKKAIRDLPEEVNLIIIGEGPERAGLLKMLKEDKLSNRILIPGAITNTHKLKEYYSHSLCSLSPGYVGLSITQSLGYGVPMLIAKEEPHSPELEAVKEKFNAFFFDSDNEQDLCDAMLEVLKNKEAFINRRLEIALDCQTRYSIEVMSQAFINLVR